MNRNPSYKQLTSYRTRPRAKTNWLRVWKSALGDRHIAGYKNIRQLMIARRIRFNRIKALRKRAFRNYLRRTNATFRQRYARQQGFNYLAWAQRKRMQAGRAMRSSTSRYGYNDPYRYYK